MKKCFLLAFVFYGLVCSNNQNLFNAITVSAINVASGGSASGWDTTIEQNSMNQEEAIQNFQNMYLESAKNGNNPKNFLNKNGSNLASVAALRGKLEILQFLIGQDVSVAPDIVNNNGYNALMQACSYGQNLCVEYLLTLPEYQIRQALEKTNNDNKTALQLAKEYYDIVKDSNRQLLIDRGKSTISALNNALGNAS